ncbi:MAG: hypothetical protein Q8939_11865 [Bacteroidota bacterium]|nr:hypothetical protein [Bacteroidota bacterium]
MRSKLILCTAILLSCFAAWIPSFSFAQNSLSKQTTIVTDAGNLSNGEKAAARILTEEVEKRTDFKWMLERRIPESGDVIVLRNAAASLPAPENKKTSRRKGISNTLSKDGDLQFPGLPPLSAKPESFRIGITQQQGRTVILIEGSDGRGVLYGAGKLLRMMRFGRTGVSAAESISLLAGLPLAESPDKPIRGHQLGYRNTANSYDGWTVAQFEQYIRDLVVFGTNSIESIPIFDEKPSPHFKIPAADMNRHISEICQQYDIDYWMWVPAQFDLKDAVKRKRYLDTMEDICKYSPRINGVFFPGGDPGDNPPELVWPLLKDIAAVLKKYHPQARTWLSLQGFTHAQSLTVYDYIQKEKPDWLGGLVTGPSSPPVQETRSALPANYPIRYYPDLTHNVRCDFPIWWWDPAFNLTLGREASNPQPYYYATLYRALQQYIDGFISYSDGAHDDVNKIIWTRMAWDPKSDEREIMKEYAGYFFGDSLAERGADGILSLEKNWEGPIVANGSIASTCASWNEMENNHPELSGNWRWQLCLLRAYYDAYTRSRFIYESQLEAEANKVLLRAPVMGADKAIVAADSILLLAETAPVHPEWHQKIIRLCDELYQSISLQTSVKKYGASGEERGAILDFLDLPLNNRWWIEDECKKTTVLSESEKIKALQRIANWEDPGPGGFYDDVGNVSRSPHVWRGEGWITDPLMLHGDDTPGYNWWDQGFSRKRLSWLTDMRWPLAMEYNGLDSTGKYHYTVRITGKGESHVKANGQRLVPTLYGKEIGDIKEFPVPADLISHGKLVLTWDDINEDNLNWRQQSRVAEVWLIRQ